MIIVSQDKETIINFESITRISIIPPVEEGDKYSIAINGCLDLGYYKTEERAKEVLIEIYRRYEHSEHLKSSKSISTQNFGEYDFIYKMPED